MKNKNLAFIAQDRFEKYIKQTLHSIMPEHIDEAKNKILEFLKIEEVLKLEPFDVFVRDGYKNYVDGYLGDIDIIFFTNKEVPEQIVESIYINTEFLIYVEDKTEIEHGYNSVNIYIEPYGDYERQRDKEDDSYNTFRTNIVYTNKNINERNLYFVAINKLNKYIEETKHSINLECLEQIKLDLEGFFRASKYKHIDILSVNVEEGRCIGDIDIAFNTTSNLEYSNIKEINTRSVKNKPDIVNIYLRRVNEN